MLAMWWVMTIAMRLPSAAPTILPVDPVNRRARADLPPFGRAGSLRRATCWPVCAIAVPWPTFDPVSRSGKQRRIACRAGAWRLLSRGPLGPDGVAFRGGGSSAFSAAIGLKNDRPVIALLDQLLSAAATAGGLNRRAGHGSVGAIDAAIFRKRFQGFVARCAFVEPMAGVGRYGFGRSVSAGRAGDHAGKGRCLIGQGASIGDIRGCLITDWCKTPDQAMLRIE